MSNFTREEVLNEVANLIGGIPTSVRDSGVLDSTQNYTRILEITSFTFLSNPDAIYYLAQLIINELSRVAFREASILEDMLVALDDLARTSLPITGTAQLSNAQTALLALERSNTIQGRSELDRFSASLDAFVRGFRQNVVSGGRVIRTREKAQEILRADLESLEETHEDLLQKLDGLRGLMTGYLSLNLPGRVSQYALSNSRKQLSDLQYALERNPSNAALSRLVTLKVLASKAVVGMLSKFSDPTEIKYRSPPNPVPLITTQLGRAAGTGSPASITTAPGPWVLPLTDLALSVNGGTPQTVSLSAIQGAILNGRNSESFSITASNRQLHAVVDPEVSNTTVTTGIDNSRFDWVNTRRLGFKQLGATVSFPDRTGSDLQPRYIKGYEAISNAPSITWSGTLNKVTGTFTPSLVSGHTGLSFKDSSSQTFEILEVLSGTEFIIDPRSMTPSTGAATIEGTNPSDNSVIVQFSPTVTGSTVTSEALIIGPAVKTAQLTTGTRTAANVVSDINSEATAATSADAALGAHVKAITPYNDFTRVALMNRSRYLPFMQIADAFVDALDITPGFNLIQDSAHSVLGFRIGERDLDIILRAAELAAAVNELAGVSAEVVETVEIEGAGTTSGTDTFLDSSTDFESLGVEQGYTLSILDGEAAGQYVIDSASGADLTLRGAEFSSSEDNLRYQVLAQRVRISSSLDGRGSSIQATTSPSEFGLTSSQVYGTTTSFEAADKKGNLLEFGGVSPGDVLKITGYDEVIITSVSGTTLGVESGVSTKVNNAPFQIRSSGERQYDELKRSLDTLYSSRNLLGRSGFNESVDAVDNALSPLLSPGQIFASNISRARNEVASLLEVITDSYSRTSEYSKSVTPADLTITEILAEYSFGAVAAVDNILDGLRDRSYDRAVDLLLAGELDGFFRTMVSTASYSSQFAQASREVVNDLPSPRQSATGVENEDMDGVDYFEDPDALDVFTDTAFEDYRE